MPDQIAAALIASSGLHPIRLVVVILVVLAVVVVVARAAHRRSGGGDGPGGGSHEGSRDTPGPPEVKR